MAAGPGTFGQLLGKAAGIPRIAFRSIEATYMDPSRTAPDVAAMQRSEIEESVTLGLSRIPLRSIQATY